MIRSSRSFELSFSLASKISRRKTKITEDSTSFWRIENVGGFDIVVHKLTAVDVVEGTGNVSQNSDGVVSVAQKLIGGLASPSRCSGEVLGIYMFHVFLTPALTKPHVGLTDNGTLVEERFVVSVGNARLEHLDSNNVVWYVGMCCRVHGRQRRRRNWLPLGKLVFVELTDTWDRNSVALLGV
ncbi:hypothetical protein HG530_004156 [Fusarium avenaceum]|nr:hypothetical protein HG530_004156 [Fusarium avenaceum]